jgi:hypothetical protein
MKHLQSIMKTAGIIFSLVFSLHLTGCMSAPKEPQKMPPVVLENGLQVTNCYDYQQMRAAFRLSETVSNQIAAAEYLTCTLAMDLRVNDNPELTMRAIYHGLSVRELPTSLSGNAETGLSLSGAGFQLWLEKSMLTFEDEQSFIQIQYKGKLKNANHLVWVSDRAKEGNYAAYFPAIIIMQDGKVLGAAAVYASGF